MTLDDLIAQFREDSGDDVGPEYLWKDATVIRYLNEAESEAAHRAMLLQESADDAVCEIAIVAGQAQYAIHPAVIDIFSALFTRTGATEPEKLHITDVFAADASERHVWRDMVEQPTALFQNDTHIRLNRKPATGGVLRIECHRMPLVKMEQAGDRPEIAEMHHRYLPYWALYRAFSKPDAETHDENRAQLALGVFTAYFGQRPEAYARRWHQSDRIQEVKASWL